MSIALIIISNEASTKADKVEIERVQRRATSHVEEISHLSYGDRLRALRLPSMEYRRKRGDMIEMYKRLNDYYDEDFPWLQRDENSNGLRGNDAKLVKFRRTNAAKRRAFSVRTINDWNGLPNEVVNAPSINAFKARLDRHWEGIMYDFPE